MRTGRNATDLEMNLRSGAGSQAHSRDCRAKNGQFFCSCDGHLVAIEMNLYRQHRHCAV
jgi:hypothetical protein